MKKLNLLTTSLVSLISAVSFAGGTGGGGVVRGNLAANLGNGSGNILREAIFHIETRPETIRLAHGIQIGNQWKIEKIEVPSRDLSLDEITAILKSEEDKTWVELN